jgi:hypothetical protein
MRRNKRLKGFGKGVASKAVALPTADKMKTINEALDKQGEFRGVSNNNNGFDVIAPSKVKKKLKGLGYSESL